MRALLRDIGGVGRRWTGGQAEMREVDAEGWVRRKEEEGVNE